MIECEFKNNNNDKGAFMMNPATAKIAPRKTKDGPTPIDAHVGARIRARRGLLGMSQKDLGKKLV